MPLPAFDLKSNVYTNFTTRPGCSRSADLVTKTWSPRPTRERSTTHQEKKLLDLDDSVAELLASLVEVSIGLAAELRAVALAIPDCLVAVDTVAGHERQFSTVRLEELAVAVRLDSVLEDVFERILLETAALGFRLDFVGMIGLHIGFSFLMMVCFVNDLNIVKYR